MMKKFLFSAAALMFAGYLSVASADEPCDATTIEFIKDGRVIDSRPLTIEEMEQYQKLEAFDMEIEALEQPLEELEALMEHKGEKIEAAVESMMQRGFSPSQRAALDEQRDKTFAELKLLMDQFRPELDKIEIKADEIKEAAEQFEALIFSQYNQEEVDRIRILDQSGESHIYMSVGEFEW